MHTPTKQQWRTVIDNFKKVLPLAVRDNHLQMEEVVVRSRHHACGTVHCVGGWYAVATLSKEEINRIYQSDSYVSFGLGTLEMSKHLGFTSDDELEQWARLHPKIWGNDMGHYMFSSNLAYNDAKTLADVVAYLEGVRDRSPD